MINTRLLWINQITSKCFCYPLKTPTKIIKFLPYDQICRKDKKPAGKDRQQKSNKNEPKPEQKKSTSAIPQQRHHLSSPAQTASTSKSATSVLPPIQSKETLLTGYDFSKEFSKRKLESNWSKYDEIPDEEENEQLKAADFEAILMAPKSIGTHFTLNSEKYWDQSNTENEELLARGTAFEQMFQLNLTTLKNGVGRLPFYLRHGYAKELFTTEEIVQMDQRVSFMDEMGAKTANLNDVNQHLLKILQSKSNDKSEGDKRNINKNPTDELDVLFDDLNLGRNIFKPQMTQATPQAAILMPGKGKSDDGATSNSKKIAVKSNNNNDENIQDWLDDILNDG